MPEAPWSAAAVEARAVSSLLSYAGNARTHPPEQVAQIAASILDFGFNVPVLVDEAGELVAGHGRDEDAATVHGTQKPVERMRRPILNNSAAGEAVYEPFCGSGTTVVAAEATSRRCLAMEIDPRYCDVVVRRWQRMKGEDAMLAGGRRMFDDIAVVRGGGTPT